MDHVGAAGVEVEVVDVAGAVVVVRVVLQSQWLLLMRVLVRSVLALVVLVRLGDPRDAARSAHHSS